MVGVNISKFKLDADRVRRNYVEAFLKKQRLTGLLPDDSMPNLADDFMLYLRMTIGFSQNYISKVMQTVKQVLRWYVRHKYATEQALDWYALSFAPPAPPKFLTPDELRRLWDFSFSS